MKPPILFARSLFLPEDLGGNRYPFEVVRRLAERGYPVTVVTPRLHGRFPSLPGVRYVLYPVTRRHPLLTHATNVLGSLLPLVREGRRDHAAAFAGSYDVALSLVLGGVTRSMPLIFLFHSEFYSEWVQALGSGRASLARRAIRAYMGLIEQRVFRGSARVVAVSEFSARQIRERLPSAASRVRVIPTGVDTAYFVPPEDKAVARQAVGYADAGVVVLGVGRLVAVKQFDRLIEGFAQARKWGLEGRLVLAGEGPDRARLEQIARDHDVAEHVDFHGFCDPPALRALMQAADFQVCSSAFENFSLAILEGLSSGLPVIGTPGGGTPELVGSLDPSLVLPDDAPSSIAEAVLRLASDHEERLHLGKAARALACERYDWERVVDRLVELSSEVRAS